jgi:hypothetical protein
MHARLCYTDAALGRDRAASRAWRVRSHDTEKTLAVDVYAVVHLQRDAEAHHLGVDRTETRLRTHAARPR